MARVEPPSLTLTSVTYFSRIALVWGLVAIIVILGAKIGYEAFLNFVSNERCKQPEAINRTLDTKIPPPNFPRQSSFEKATSYALQLRDDQTNVISTLIPETPLKDTTMRVYPQVLPSLSVSADTQVRNIASQLGLTGNPEIINELYTWQNGNTTFEINRRTLAFNYHSDYLSNSEYLHSTGKTLPTSAEATKLVKDQLTALDLLPDDMASISAQVTYMRVIGNELSQVSAVDQADFVQVALQREDVRENTTDDRCREIEKTYPFVGLADQPSAIVGIVGRNWVGQDQIVSLLNTYENYDWGNYGVYHARTLEEAWSVVQAGNAYVANLGATSEVVINKISIGYFEDNQEQAYLQPVYIFESDSGHRAYVPAISSSEFDTNKLLNPNGSVSLPSNYAATSSSSLATGSANPIDAALNAENANVSPATNISVEAETSPTPTPSPSPTSSSAPVVLTPLSNNN